MSTEIIWKQVPGFSNYEVNNIGQIRNLHKRILTLKTEEQGYVKKKLIDDNGNKIYKSVHWCVCRTFNGPPYEDKIQVDHINKIRNDNRAENLRWANSTDQLVNRTKSTTNKISYRINQICPKTFQIINTYNTAKEISIKLKFDSSYIVKSVHNGNLCHGFYWKYEEISLIEGEIWVKIKRGTKEFFISNFGRIKDIKYERLRPLNKSEYLRIHIDKKMYNVHILVAETFIPNLDSKPVVNHKDCNKHNNKVDNLEWCTSSENTLHAWKNGRYENCYKKVYEYDAKSNELIKIYKSHTEASFENKIGLSEMHKRIKNQKIVNNKRWSKILNTPENSTNTETPT